MIAVKSSYSNSGISYAAVYTGIREGNTVKRFNPDPTDPVPSRVNRQKIAETNGFRSPYSLLIPQETNVIAVASRPMEQDADSDVCADAIVTDEMDHTLMVAPADCPCLGYFDMKQGVYALAHCSANSTGMGLPAKVLEVMGGRVEDIKIITSPYIKPESYVFPEELLSKFFGDSQWKKHIKYESGSQSARVDVMGNIIDQLTSAGVPISNIEVSPIDTYSNPAYFSNKGGKENPARVGRNAFVLAMKANGGFSRGG